MIRISITVARWFSWLQGFKVVTGEEGNEIGIHGCEQQAIMPLCDELQAGILDGV